MKIAWGFYQICVLIPAVYRIPEDPQTPDHQVVAGYTLTCYSHTFGPHIGTEVEMPPDVADALNFFSLTVRAARPCDESAALMPLPLRAARNRDVEHPSQLLWHGRPLLPDRLPDDLASARHRLHAVGRNHPGPPLQANYEA